MPKRNVSKKQARFVSALLSAMHDSGQIHKTEHKQVKGAGCIVVNPSDHILIGKRTDNDLLDLPGGYSEPGESHDQTALRELEEETGLKGSNPKLLDSPEGHKVFIIDSYTGEPHDTDELKDVGFHHPDDIDLDSMSDRGRKLLKLHFSTKVKKSRSLIDMYQEDRLAKNILRHDVGKHVVHEVTHGDALRLVGTGAFRWLRNQVRDMKDEGFKEVAIDHYKVQIRKHANDVYSGRIIDGHKQVHQFVNRSLPALAAELMSLFEWYTPEDEPDVDNLEDKDLQDSAVSGGLSKLVEDYKKNSLANIYTEMENIREEIRNGNAVDLQQVEQKIMKLFDKLEDNLHSVIDKHNKLSVDAGKEIDELHNKLLTLQSKLDELSKKPTTIEAYTQDPQSASKIHSNEYMYLSKPSIEISPDGRVRITFSNDWTPMEQNNFLRDMKARTLKKAKRNVKS